MHPNVGKQMTLYIYITKPVNKGGIYVHAVPPEDRVAVQTRENESKNTTTLPD